MSKNKSQLQSRRSKKNYIPPKIIPLSNIMSVETATCSVGTGPGCGACEMCDCSSGDGATGVPIMI